MQIYLKHTSEGFIARIIMLILGTMFLCLGGLLIPIAGSFSMLIGGIAFFYYAVFLKPQAIRFKRHKDNRKKDNT